MTFDAIDTTAGSEAGPARQDLGAHRPRFLEGARACREAVLAPADDLGLGHALRIALAARMARLNGDEDLWGTYRARLEAEGAGPDLVLLASGGHPAGADAPLRALLRHVDLVTVAPRAATRRDTERLTACGVTVPQVVALSELIGFVNFETRIRATFKLLGVPDDPAR